MMNGVLARAVPFVIRHLVFFIHPRLGGRHLQQARALERGEKILFHGGKTFSGDGISRDQNEFHRLGKFVLMLPETFAQQPPRPVARDRAADFFARDHAQFWARAGRQFVPVGDQTAEREAFPAQPDARKIAALREPRLAAQAQALRRGLHKKSNGREPFAAIAAAVGQRGLAALGGITVQESVLTFTADFRRLILAFHKIK